MKMQPIWDKCKHGKWKSLGISGDFWQEVQCGKCGFVQALACQHGGSVACQNCVNSFLRA